MAYELVMPRLGWTMEEGTFLEWLKKDGDQINVGDIVFTVESDKAVNEVEAMEAGILRIPPDTPPSGTKMLVGALLGYIVQPGERAPFEGSAIAASAAPAKSEGSPVPAAPSASTMQAVAVRKSKNGKPPISPRARRIAGELGVDWDDLKGSGRTGRIVERDVRAAAEARAAAELPLKVTPLARRMAQDLGVNLQELSASKGGERITRADVQAATSPAPAAASVPIVPTANEEIVPISAIRRVIAERMSASAHTVAPVTLTVEADATELVKLRKQLKADLSASGRPVPSYNDLLAKLCAEALQDNPYVNARFEGENIVLSRDAHIGIAVDTDRGLLVPVMREVNRKSLRQITAESASLIDRARKGQLKGDEMRGGTFSITNLGMFGIDAFTPIINLPECAILGVGRIVPKQVVVDAEAETLAIRHMMFLSLTFDHRLVDGAQAARFLQRLCQFLLQPTSWLI